jgi:hypothetical protein
MITFLNILISSSIIPKMTLVYPIIHLVMSQYQLLLSQKVTSLCPIIHLVMTQISTSPVPKKHIVMSHNLSQRDPKLTSPVPKSHIIMSQNSSCYDHESTSPVPKSDLVLSHISSRYDVISTSPVPKTTLFCPIIRLVMTQYHVLLSQKVTLFVP